LEISQQEIGLLLPRKGSDIMQSSFSHGSYPWLGLEPWRKTEPFPSARFSDIR
jgi:hypothetical protein